MDPSEKNPMSACFLYSLKQAVGWMFTSYSISLTLQSLDTSRGWWWSQGACVPQMKKCKTSTKHLELSILGQLHCTWLKPAHAHSEKRDAFMVVKCLEVECVQWELSLLDKFCNILTGYPSKPSSWHRQEELKHESFGWHSWMLKQYLPGNLKFFSPNVADFLLQNSDDSKSLVPFARDI